MARSCEDYGKLGCAILAVGGWADGYTAAVFRLVENLKRPDVKGIAGPWGHLYPQRGIPGPGHRLPAGMQALVGPLAEGRAERRRERSGPAAVAAGLCSAPAALRPSPRPLDRPQWLARRLHRARLLVAQRRRSGACARRQGRARDPLAPDQRPRQRRMVRPTASARWPPNCRLDQRIDDAGSLVFDSAPLDKEMVLVGDPTAHLDIARRPTRRPRLRAAERRGAGWAGHEGHLRPPQSHPSRRPLNPAKLEPGRRYKVKVRLNEIAHVLAAGHRLRVAVSTSCFPLTWPSPEPVTLTLHAGESLHRGCRS